MDSLLIANMRKEAQNYRVIYFLSVNDEIGMNFLFSTRTKLTFFTTYTRQIKQRARSELSRTSEHALSRCGDKMA